jgi:hypothetical protein
MPSGIRSGGATGPDSTFHHRLNIMSPTSRWLLLFIGLLLPSAAALSQYAAWNKKPGEYYLGIGLTSLTAEEEYGYDGALRLLFADTALFRDGEFGMTDISFQGELGITDWLTGVASTQYKVAVRQAVHRPTGRDTTASASGLGDLWIGLRTRLIPEEKPYAASVTLSLKLPTGSPYQEIPLGTGVLDYEAAAAIGTRIPVFEGIEGIAQLSGGYRMRNIASDEINYALDLAIDLRDALLLRLTMDGVHSTADFDRVTDEPANALGQRAFVADQSFNRWNLAMIYGATETMDISLGYNWNGAGRNTLASGGLALGVAWSVPAVSE